MDTFAGGSDQMVPDEYDFAAREEHNAQGRWISPDPVRGTGNKYVYADNNPLSKVDIYGMYAIEINGIERSSNEEQLMEGTNELTESHAPDSTQTPPTPTTEENTQSSGTNTAAEDVRTKKGDRRDVPQFFSRNVG